MLPSTGPARGGTGIVKSEKILPVTRLHWVRPHYVRHDQALLGSESVPIGCNAPYFASVPRRYDMRGRIEFASVVVAVVR